MRVILIDDEPMALENFRYVIRQCEGVEILGAFTDPFEALQRLGNLKPDAVFLDIEMPQINGFTVAEEIYAALPDACIIFVTGYNQYAVKAFEINALDYIVKPISKKRLKQAIEKLTKNSEKGLQGKQSGKSIGVFDSLYSKQINKIVARKGEKIVLLNPEQVLYLCVKKGNVYAVTEHQIFSVHETLNYWEERLSESSFFRCHRAFLINIDKIKIIIPMFNNTYNVKFSNHSDNIPVSRKYAKQLKQLLGL